MRVRLGDGADHVDMQSGPDVEGILVDLEHGAAWGAHATVMGRRRKIWAAALYALF